MRKLGYTKIAGGSSCHIKRKIDRLGIDSSHFTGQGHTKGKPAFNRKSAEEILVHRKCESRPKGIRLTRALIEIGRKYECEECSCDDNWRGKTITLHVDHKDGSWDNNTKENLRFLCPNCHAATDNFGNKKRT